MGVLYPLSLSALASLGVLVLIYLRARTRSVVDVPSLMLFEKSLVATSRVRRFQVDLLFWLEVAALTGLSLALAGLYLKSAPLPMGGTRRALVFDIAASMGAQDQGSSRLAQAQAAARKLLNHGGFGDQYAVAVYAAEPQMVTYFTSDLKTVRAAIGSLAVRDVAASPAAFAAALMRVRDADRIELYAPRMPALVNDAQWRRKLDFHQIGTALPNGAIAELDPGIPGQTPGHCVVRNLGRAPLLAPVQILLDNQPLVNSAVVVPAGGHNQLDFGPLPRGGIVEARLGVADALAADNQRFALAQGPRPLHAIVVSPDPEVREDLARVVRATDSAAIVAMASPQDLRQNSAAKLFGGAGPDLALLHDSDPNLVAAQAKLEIFPPLTPKSASAQGLAVVGTLANSQLDDRADRGPLVRPLLLGFTRILVLPGWLDPLAHGSGPLSNQALPMAAAGVDSSGRLGVIAFDIRDHRLLNPDMLDTLVLTVDLLKRLTAPSNLQVVQTGSYVAVPLRAATKVMAPDGAVSELVPDTDGLARFKPLQAGVYRIGSGPAQVLVFANYFDNAESELSIANGSQSGPALAAPSPDNLGPTRIQRLSVLLITLALALMLAETLMLVRRAWAGGMTSV